jgi:hypothetical protein
MVAEAPELIDRCKKLALELKGLNRDSLAAALDWCDQPWNTTTEFWINYLDTLRLVRRGLRFRGPRETQRTVKNLIREIEHILA